MPCAAGKLYGPAVVHSWIRPYMDHWKPMSRVLLTRVLLMASVAYVVFFYFFGAAIKPGYSQLSNFVSEYNATGTPWAGMLTYVGFVATAAFLACFLVAAAPVAQVSGVSRVGFWLLWSVPFSFLIGAIAPCDAGCPAEGSASQTVHTLLGALAYVGMGTGIALLSFAPSFRPYRWRRLFMIFTGLAFPVVFIIMVQSDFASFRGLLQRLLDVVMAVSLLLTVFTILATERRVSSDVC